MAGSAATARRWVRPAVLDRIEQAIIVVLWGFFAWRMLDHVNPMSLLAFLSETAIIVFVVIRRPTEKISTDHGEWMLAFAATCAPLMVERVAPPFPWLLPVILSLQVVGVAASIAAKLALRRSFGIAPANRGLKLTGPYRVVRHPMYGGYLLSHIGFLLASPTVMNIAIYAIGWTAQVRRLLAEERLLSEDPRYREYMGEVRWRLIPGVY